MSQNRSPHLTKESLPFAGLWLLAALVLLLAVVLPSCSTSTSRPVPNVILISIDTCRADYLSCYGYRKETTPNIDAFADQAALFENVISPVPLTLPAHCSMLTGTIPPHHAVHDNFDYWLDGANITLAEILHDNTFATAAFVSAFVLDSQFALNQGFDTYYDHFEQQADQFQANERRADQTTRLALDWLENQKHENFFLFLHYYDPHTDYEPPEPFASKFADNLYAGEIAYTDHYIGKVLQKLKSLGIFDSSLIIITSDHGEMLAEHGEDEHGYFIYQSALKVPLIFKLPGQHTPQRIKDLAGLVDIVPTVCGLLGIAPPTPLQGRDLSPCLENSSISSKERHIYAESLYPTKYGGNSLLGLVGRRYKYIQTTRPELYDLQLDPAESENLIESRPQLAAELREQLRQRLEENVRKLKSGARPAHDDETIRRLESLGYVAGAVSELFEFDQDRQDPKDLLGFYVSTTKVNRLMTREKFDQARVLCEQLLLQHPDYYGLHRTLGKIAASKGDTQNAKAYMLKSLQLNPNQADLHNHLGMILGEENRLAEAIHHLGESLALNPNQAGAHFASGNVLERQGRLDQAADHYTTILQLDPTSAAAHNNLASVLLRQGKYDQAELHCTKALQINPQLPEAYYNLGNIRFQQGNFQQAVINYQKALALRPNWPDAQKNLSIAKSRTQSFAP
ncbi:MAG: sulfatase-like hydrolase/transferase [Planctomycetota bacterium]|jgi:arylsulfatase A-like enzyme/Flp pilus assembly protein TadD